MKFHFFTAPFSLQLKFPLIESFAFCPGGRPTLTEVLLTFSRAGVLPKKGCYSLAEHGKIELIPVYLYGLVPNLSATIAICSSVKRLGLPILLVIQTSLATNSKCSAMANARSKLEPAVSTP